MKKFKFEETIKAKNGGYAILSTNRLSPNLHYLLNDFQDIFLKDGTLFIMGAQSSHYDEFKREYLEGNNEAAVLCEMFVTRKGNKFIYWRDEELDIDYLTKYEE